MEFEYCDLGFLCRHQEIKAFLSDSVSGYFDVPPFQAGSDLTVEGLNCKVCTYYDQNCVFQIKATNLVHRFINTVT